MKRVLIFIITVFILMIPCALSMASTTTDTEMLFNDTLFFENANLSTVDIGLSALLYQTTSESQVIFPRGWAIFLNILPGFGLGSALQGDKINGMVQLCVSLVSATVGSIMIIYGLSGGAGDGSGSFMPGNGEFTTGVVILSVGIGSSIIYGIFSAIFFNPNQKDEKIDIDNDNSNNSETPTIQIYPQGLGIGLSIDF